MPHSFNLNIAGGRNCDNIETCGDLLTKFSLILYEQYPKQFMEAFQDIQSYPFLKTELEIQQLEPSKKKHWRQIQNTKLCIDTNRSIEATLGTMVRMASLFGHCYITIRSVAANKHDVFVHGL